MQVKKHMRETIFFLLSCYSITAGGQKPNDICYIAV